MLQTLAVLPSAVAPPKFLVLNFSFGKISATSEITEFCWSTRRWAFLAATGRGARS